MKGDAFWNVERKRVAVKDAEGRGLVADSMEVRMELIAKMERGELTLEQVQTELAAIKKNAKKCGKVTRAQSWRNG